MKTLVVFTPTDTGLLVSDISYSFCSKLSDGSAVDTTGTTLQELSDGVYILTNPNITEDTIYRVYVTALPTSYSIGQFIIADIAEQTTLTALDGKVDTVDTVVDSILVNTDVATSTRLAAADYTAAPTAGDNATAVAEYLVTGNQVKNSIAWVLKQLKANIGPVGTLRSGGNGHNIVQLAVDAPTSSIDPSIIVFTKGDDMQVGRCTQYDGVNKLVTLRRELKTPVDNTWDYTVIGVEGGQATNDGLAQGGGTNYAYLNLLANEETDAYKDQLFIVTADSANEDQARYINTSFLEAGKVRIEWDEPMPAAIAVDTSYEILQLKRDSRVGTILGRVPGVVLEAADYVAPDNASITSILANTDVATSTRLAAADYTTPPTANEIATAIGLDSQTILDIKAQTDQLVFAGGDVVATLNGEVITVDKTGYSLTAAYDAAKTAATQTSVDTIDTNVDTVLTRTDVATSTRLAAASYTTPPTAQEIATEVGYSPVDVTAIKAVTDQIVFVGDRVKVTLASETVAVGDKTGFSLTAAYDAAKTAASATDLATVDTNVDSIKLTVDTNLDMQVSLVSANVWTEANAVTIFTKITELYKWFKNKRILTKNTLTEYSEVIYDDNGTDELRTITYTKTGNTETRE